MNNRQFIKRIMAFFMSLLMVISTISSSAIHAYAEEGFYHVTFHANYTDENGNLHEGLIYNEPQYSEDIPAGEPVKDPVTAVSAKGLVFMYWTDSVDGTGKNYTPEDLAEQVLENDTDLYAVYGYEIQVNYNGGYTDIDGDISYDIHMNIPEFSVLDTKDLVIPKHDDGWDFLGWSSALEEPFELKETYDPSADGTELYAIWDMRYTVVLNAGEGAFPDGENTLTLKGEVNTLIESLEGFALPVKEGKKLYSWTDQYDNEIMANDFLEYSVYENNTYTANYRDAIQLTFNANGGYFLDGDKKVSSITIDYIPGEYFDNVPQLYHEDDHMQNDTWDYLGESVYNYDLELLIQNLSEDAVFTANWDKRIIVTLHGSGGYFNNDPNQTDYFSYRTEGDIYASSFPAVKADNGMTLDYWTFEDGSIFPNDIPYHLVEDIDLYARWADAVPVSFDFNGGSYTDWNQWNDETSSYEKASVKTYMVKKDSLIRNTVSSEENSLGLELNTPNGSFLLGWSTSKEGESVLQISDIEGMSAYEPLTFYAVWKEPVSLTFHTTKGYYEKWEGEHNVKIDYQTVKIPKGGKLSNYINDPQCDDPAYGFKGWSLKEDGSGEIYDSYQIQELLTFDEDTDLYAVWKELYEVKFDYNGGIDVNGNHERTVTNDDNRLYKAQLPEVRYEDGSKAFAGWSLQKDTMEEIPFEEYEEYSSSYECYTLTKSITLYAMWEDAYAATFHTGDNGYFMLYNSETGEDEENTELVYGVKKGGKLQNEISEPLARDDYSFIGWSMNPDGSGVRYTSYQLKNIVTFNEPKDFYAVYDTKYAVTLDFNGGYTEASIGSNIFYAAKGEHVHLLTPQREGKIFVAWTSEKDNLDTNVLTHDDSSTYYICTGDITLYAYWSDTVSAVFHANGGQFRDGGSVVSYDVAENGHLNSYVSEPSANSDKAFIGWSLNEDGSGEVYSLYQIQELIQFDESKDFYAVWGETYKVTFDFNGGKDYEGRTSYVDKAAKGKYVYLYDMPEHPDKHKTFVGWTLEKDNPDTLIEGTSSASSIVCTGEMTIYAYWRNNIVISFYENLQESEEAFNEYTTEAGIHNIAYSVPACEGKAFLGWSTDKDAKEAEYPYNVDDTYINQFGVSEDISLYAVWGEQYTITFDMNGGSFTGYYKDKYYRIVKNVSVQLGDHVQFSFEIEPEVNDDTKLFAGWSKDPDATEPEYKEYDVEVVKGNQTYYAVWGDTVLITLDFNGGYSTGYYGETIYSEERRFIKGQDVWVSQLSDAYRDDDYVLGGWSTDPEALGTVYEVSDCIDNVSEDMLLYAYWVKPYHLVFNAGEGYLFDQDYIKVHQLGELIVPGDETYLSREPFLEGAGDEMFAGWSLRADADEIAYHKYDSITLEDDLTLYAVYGKRHTITFDANGGYFQGYEGTSRFIQSRQGAEGALIHQVSTEYPVHTDVTLRFAGWSLTKDGEPEDSFYDKIIEEDTTLYACWKKVVNITLDAGDGYFAGSHAQKEILYINQGSPMKIWMNPEDIVCNDASKAYARKWSTEPDGTGKVYTMNQLYDEIAENDMTFYAVYDKGINITLDANGGVFHDKSQTQTKFIAENDRISYIDVPQKDNVIFVGWAEDPKAERPDYKKHDLDDVKAVENITYYAIYADVVEVTLDANGKQFETDGEQITLEAAKGYEYGYSYFEKVLSKENEYIAERWNTKPDGTGTEVNDLFGYIFTEDITLYAQWAVAKKIIFHGNGGTYAGEKEYTEYVSEERGLRSYYNTECDEKGKTLSVWTTNPDGTGDAYTPDELFALEVKGDIDLYAQWAKAWIVTLDANGGYFYNDNSIYKAETADGYSPSMISYPEYEGKIILGWSKTKDGTPVEIESEIITDDVTYYAIWKERIDPTGITFRNDEITLSVDEKVYPGYVIEPEEADIDYIEIISSDSSIVSYEKGLLVGKKAGSAEITVTVNNKLQASAKVTVKDKVIPVTSISMNQTAIVMKAGRTELLKPVIEPADATNKEVIWTSSNEKTATVDAKGIVTANNAGTAIITAEADGQKAECQIIVEFDDVQDATKSFYNPVYWAVEQGVTTGTSETTFSPVNACTRAQFVTFLWRQQGKPEPKSTNSPFKDVQDPSRSYYKAVLWALENGITTGTSPTAFSPGAPCTRAQVVTFLWRANGEPANEIKVNPFKDVPGGLSYSKAVLWALENKITTGKSATSFAPGDPCTRAQTVTFLYRTYKE